MIVVRCVGGGGAGGYRHGRCGPRGMRRRRRAVKRRRTRRPRTHLLILSVGTQHLPRLGGAAGPRKQPGESVAGGGQRGARPDPLPLISPTALAPRRLPSLTWPAATTPLARPGAARATAAAWRRAARRRRPSPTPAAPAGARPRSRSPRPGAGCRSPTRPRRPARRRRRRSTRRRRRRGRAARWPFSGAAPSAAGLPAGRPCWPASLLGRRLVPPAPPRSPASPPAPGLAPPSPSPANRPTAAPRGTRLARRGAAKSRARWRSRWRACAVRGVAAAVAPREGGRLAHHAATKIVCTQPQQRAARGASGRASWRARTAPSWRGASGPRFEACPRRGAGAADFQRRATAVRAKSFTARATSPPPARRPRSRARERGTAPTAHQKARPRRSAL